MKKSAGSLVKFFLPIVSASFLLLGCPSEETDIVCGAGYGDSADIALDKVEQGEGPVWYRAFYEEINLSRCPAEVIGVEVPYASALEGKQVNLIINHLTQDKSIAEIVQDPNLFITVSPGSSLEDWQMDLLFNGQTTMPIYNRLQGFLTYSSSSTYVPDKFFVKLHWSE